MANKKKYDRVFLPISGDSPFVYTEAYKSLRTNLSFVSMNSQFKAIAVTSSIPGEGKSNVAINLAITLAETNGNVLLVDCDLRKPTIHRYLQIADGKKSGLTSILSGRAQAEYVIKRIQALHLDVLCSGPIPPNPAEMLGSRQMKAFIDGLKERYDYIILDTPPVSVVTDAAVLSRLADGVILVIRQNHCSIETAQLAKKNLESVEARIIGAVLNGFDVKKSNKSSGYYSSDYYSDYEAN